MRPLIPRFQHIFYLCCVVQLYCVLFLISLLSVLSCSFLIAVGYYNETFYLACQSGHRGRQLKQVILNFRCGLVISLQGSNNQNGQLIVALLLTESYMVKESILTSRHSITFSHLKPGSTCVHHRTHYRGGGNIYFGRGCPRSKFRQTKAKRVVRARYSCFHRRLESLA